MIETEHTPLSFDSLPIVDQMIKVRKDVRQELVPKYDDLILKTFELAINPVVQISPENV